MYGRSRYKYDDVTDRLTALEDKYVKVTWFERVSSGTSGSLSLPTGASVVLNEWQAGIDAVTTQLDPVDATGYPTFTSPEDSGGALITTTLDGDGNYVLSGTPSEYPIGIIYVYIVKFANFDKTYCIGGIEMVESYATGIMTSEVNFGTAPPNTNGNWRIRNDGTDLVFEVRLVGIWTPKFKLEAS